MGKFLVIAALAFLIFWVGARWGYGRKSNQTSFAPVSQLTPQVRARIDEQLAQGQVVTAIKTYRKATGASLVAAKTAIETYAAERSA